MRRPPGRLVLAAALAVLLAGTACGGGAAPAAAPSPRRIIAIAPSSVEILFTLGLGERVVGVGDWIRFPPEAASLPRLGGLLDPNLERIVTLAPELAVLLPSEEVELGDRLRRLGVETLVVGSDSLEDTEAAVAAVARRCGVEARAQAFLAEWRAALAPRPPAPGRAPPRVFLSLAREPGRLAEILSAGPGSFPDELLARLGAENVLADAATAFPQVGLEAVIARGPEVLVELHPQEAGEELTARLAGDWAAFPQIPAVRDRRVRILAGTHTLIPGPRLARLYRELEEAIFGAAGEAAAP